MHTPAALDWLAGNNGCDKDVVIPVKTGIQQEMSISLCCYTIEAGIV